MKPNDGSIQRMGFSRLDINFGCGRMILGLCAGIALAVLVVGLVAMGLLGLLLYGW